MCKDVKKHGCDCIIKKQPVIKTEQELENSVKESVCKTCNDTGKIYSESCKCKEDCHCKTIKEEKEKEEEKNNNPFPHVISEKEEDSSKKEEGCDSKIKIENNEPIHIKEDEGVSEYVKKIYEFIKNDGSISIMEDMQNYLFKDISKTDKNIARIVLSGVEEVEASLGRLKTQKLSLDRRILMLEGVLKQYNLYIEENMEKILSSAMDAVEIKQSSSEYKSGDIRKGTYNNNRTLFKHKEL